MVSWRIETCIIDNSLTLKNTNFLPCNQNKDQFAIHHGEVEREHTTEGRRATFLTIMTAAQIILADLCWWFSGRETKRPSREKSENGSGNRKAGAASGSSWAQNQLTATATFIVYLWVEASALFYPYNTEWQVTVLKNKGPNACN